MCKRVGVGVGVEGSSACKSMCVTFGFVNVCAYVQWCLSCVYVGHMAADACGTPGGPQERT